MRYNTIAKWAMVLAAGALIAAVPAAALKRVGAGGAIGFALPAADFDNDAKTAPIVAGRVSLQLFHWLALEGGADYHLNHNTENENTGLGATRLFAYRAGLAYKIDMGVFKPYVAAGAAYFHERIYKAHRPMNEWVDYDKPGCYIGPGLEYYFDEPFLAWGTLSYGRIFDGARADDHDTQFIQLEFGLTYYFF
jgi:hypothetical protein